MREHGWRRVSTLRSARVAVTLVVALSLGVVAQVPASSSDHPAANDLETRQITGADPTAAAVAASREAYVSAETVVIARDDGAGDALVGAPIAARFGGPLLLSDRDELRPDVLAEIDRLGTTNIVLIGGPLALSTAVENHLRQTPADATVQRIFGPDRFSTAVAAARFLTDASGGGSTGLVVTIARVTPDSVTAAALAASRGIPVIPVQTTSVHAVTATYLRGAQIDAVTVVGGTDVVAADTAERLGELSGAPVDRLGGRDRFDTAVLIADEVRATLARRDGAALDTETGTGALGGESAVWLLAGEGPDAVAGGVAAGAQGGVALLVDGSRIERSRASARWLTAAMRTGATVVVFGDSRTLATDLEEQVVSLVRGPMLPGGGRFLFPDRRIVAPYGTHFGPELGPLGEQPAEDVGPLLQSTMAGYEDGQIPVVPGIDLIATLAVREAGDGTYRKRSRAEEVQGWLDAARENDAYLIIDIQPGRADLMEEIQFYEPFLREPDVGLAVDIEWISRPPRRPGDNSIGHMLAAEVNEVAAYLSHLVVAEGLPEKLLLLHAFVPNQIRNPEDIQIADGVAILMHMDGLGTPGGKMLRYRQLQLPLPHYNGFKIFDDFDDPVLTPAQVMALEPEPFVITYQ